MAQGLRSVREARRTHAARTLVVRAVGSFVLFVLIFRLLEGGASHAWLRAVAAGLVFALLWTPTTYVLDRRRRC